MTMKLTTEDKRDLDRFTKYLVLKAAQLIVDSRQGHLTSTLTKSSCDSLVPCNLAIPSIVEVLQSVKGALKADCALIDSPLCIEISLRTLDGNTMVLETWKFGITADKDMVKAVSQNVYYRMGNMLKSVVSLTRVTPAYKMARRQSSESYIILYRIYMGEPNETVHGEAVKTLRVGQLCTPLGALHLTLYYRTQMILSPTKEKNSIMVKSDHYKINIHMNEVDLKNIEDIDFSKDFKCGPFATSIENSNLENEILELKPPPFENLFKKSFQNVSEDKKIFSCKPSPQKDGDQNGNTPEVAPPDITMVSTNDDFIMVELKPLPFATDGKSIDLGTFHKEWQTATPLQSFNNTKTFGDQVPDYTKKLEVFEAEVLKYDEMVSTLCRSNNN